METITYDSRPICAESYATKKRSAAIDRTMSVEINGSMQRIRICSENAASPPVIVVQAGPGFPVLHEVRKFQRKLALERKLAVCYWDQRGCGKASKQDAESVSFQQQVNDLRALIRWAVKNSGRKVTLLGVSLGATYSLLAAEQEQHNVNAVVVISPDINIAESDASTAEFLAARAPTMSRRFNSNLKKLGDPPYEDPQRFQLRARLLLDAGVIENGKRFNATAVELLTGLFRTYGPVGAANALRGMNIIQAALLSEIARLNVLTDLPLLDVPVHCILGDLDPLMPTVARDRLARLSGYSVTNIPEAGHMAHFDRPHIVSSIVFRAAYGE
ncbi:MAG: alpha/beta hydrolase [Acidobacteriota bacterium]